MVSFVTRREKRWKGFGRKEKKENQIIGKLDSLLKDRPKSGSVG